MAKAKTEEKATNYTPHRTLNEDSLTLSEWKKARGYDTKKRKYAND